MTRIPRRNLLLAGTALPAVLSAARKAMSADTASPRRFEAVAGYEISDAVKLHALALLPLGSLEFHGPHNPLGTDAIIISGIAERVAALTNALLFPTVSFTHCPAHTARFQGTISIRPEVMTLYFEDILRSTLNLGFSRIFVLNGHDGNIGPARAAISKVAHENPSAAMLFASWWEMLPGEEMKQLGLFHQANGGHGHGGPLETSAVAAFRPEWVHPEKARDLPPPPDLGDGMPYYLEKATAESWPGYSGRVSETSVAKGRQLVQLSEGRLVKLVENWLAHSSTPGSW